jgi:hypothetical protein
MADRRAETGSLASAIALTLMLLNGAAFAAGPSYPPYPDVWEWHAPAGEGVVKDLSTTLLSNGDVLIRAVYEKDQQQKSERYYLMFDNAALDEAKTKLGRGVVLRDGTMLPPLAVASTKIELSDGTTVDQYSRRYRLCYRGPARDFFIVSDSSGREIAHKSLFYLLEKPKRFEGGGGYKWFDEPNASCPTEGPLNLEVSVESISADLLPLRDGTFLMILPEHSLVMRLNPDLTSRSRVLNDRVFVFDYHGDPMIVSELTHKDYGSTDDFMDQQHYQQALDDFRDYLRGTRRSQAPQVAAEEIGHEHQHETDSPTVRRADGA